MHAYNWRGSNRNVGHTQQVKSTAFSGVFVKVWSMGKLGDCEVR